MSSSSSCITKRSFRSYPYRGVVSDVANELRVPRRIALARVRAGEPIALELFIAILQPRLRQIDSVNRLLGRVQRLPTHLFRSHPARRILRELARLLKVSTTQASLRVRSCEPRALGLFIRLLDETVRLRDTAEEFLSDFSDATAERKSKQNLRVGSRVGRKKRERRSSQYPHD